MALQTFTAGQVLTAAQVTALQTNDFNQTVDTKVANYTLVAGDAGKRIVGNGTSITFTVNNTVFNAGDTIKLHNINSTALTIAAGSGVTINAAAGLTMAQWQEATLFATSASSFILFESTASSAQGLTLLQSVTFSAVSSQSVNSVFSSTYDNYKILIKMTNSLDTEGIRIRFRVSNTDASGANYNFQYIRGNNTSITGLRETGLTSMLFGFGHTAGVGIPLDIFNPALTLQTQIYATSYVPDLMNNFAGRHTLSTAYDGFTLIMDTGTMTGTVSVYGYNK